MFRQIIESIEGVEIFPLIAMFVFIILFAGILYWVFRMDKNYVKKMKHLPLESNRANVNHGEHTDE